LLLRIDGAPLLVGLLRLGIVHSLPP
jgi:hypothetical protein